MSRANNTGRPASLHIKGRCLDPEELFLHCQVITTIALESVTSELAAYQRGEGIYSTPFLWEDVADPEASIGVVLNTGPDATKDVVVGVVSRKPPRRCCSRILSIVASSAAVERVFRHTCGSTARSETALAIRGWRNLSTWRWIEGSRGVGNDESMSCLHFPFPSPQQHFSSLLSAGIDAVVRAVHFHLPFSVEPFSWTNSASPTKNLTTGNEQTAQHKGRNTQRRFYLYIVRIIEWREETNSANCRESNSLAQSPFGCLHSYDSLQSARRREDYSTFPLLLSSLETNRDCSNSIEHAAVQETADDSRLSAKPWSSQPVLNAPACGVTASECLPALRWIANLCSQSVSNFAIELQRR